MIIGERIRNIREDKDILQQELADAVGINVSVLSRIEKGTRQLRDDELIKIADKLNVSVDYLLGRTDEPQGTGFQKGLLGDINDDSPLAQKARETKPNLDSEDLLAQLHQEGIMLDGRPLTAADAERLRDTIAFAIDQAKKTQGQQ